MTASTVTIDGTVYAPVQPGQTVRQIIVTAGRWNFVADVEDLDGGDLVLHDAQVIRYWGTTKGLGELALDGPTSKTKLDAAGTVRVPARSLIVRIDVTSSL